MSASKVVIRRQCKHFSVPSYTRLSCWDLKLLPCAGSDFLIHSVEYAEGVFVDAISVKLYKKIVSSFYSQFFQFERPSHFVCNGISVTMTIEDDDDNNSWIIRTMSIPSPLKFFHFSSCWSEIQFNFSYHRNWVKPCSAIESKRNGQISQ